MGFRKFGEVILLNVLKFLIQDVLCKCNDGIQFKPGVSKTPEVMQTPSIQPYCI